MATMNETFLAVTSTFYQPHLATRRPRPGRTSPTLGLKSCVSGRVTLAPATSRAPAHSVPAKDAVDLRSSDSLEQSTFFDAWLANDLAAAPETPEGTEADLVESPEFKGEDLQRCGAEQGMSQGFSIDELLEQALQEVQQQKQDEETAAAALAMEGSTRMSLSPEDLGWLHGLLPRTVSPQMMSRPVLGSTIDMTVEGYSPDLTSLGTPVLAAMTSPPALQATATTTAPVRSSLPYDAPTLPRRGFAEKRRMKRRSSEESQASGLVRDAGAGGPGPSRRPRGRGEGEARARARAWARAGSSVPSMSTASELDHDEPEPLPEENADDPDEPALVALKRRQNTLAARRSRMRKAQEMQELRGRIEALEAENRQLRARLEGREMD